MNDFTKEELEILIAIIDNMYFGQFYADARVPKLYSKIQTMIGTYCEHSESIMDCDGGISLVCKSCGITTMNI